MSVIVDTPLRNISRKITSKYIGYGDTDVLYPDSYYVLDETTGEKITDEQGNYILQEVHSPYVLDEDGSITTDENDLPVLEENYRTYIIQGVATQLDSLSIDIQYVTIQAKQTNIDKIWVGNRGVARYKGMYLLPTSEPLTLNIDRLTKIYIIGNAGEGVKFLYGTREDIFLENTDGDLLQNTDGSDLENPT